MAEATQISTREASTGSKTIADIAPAGPRASTPGKTAPDAQGRRGVGQASPYEELGQSVKEVALGLIDIGIAKGDRGSRS